MTQAPEYRLVPVEPTEAMIEAGFSCINYGTTVESDMERAWSSMIAAAPHTAAPAADRAVSELSDEQIKRIHDTTIDYSIEGYRTFARAVIAADRALARSTDAPSEPVGWMSPIEFKNLGIARECNDNRGFIIRPSQQPDGIPTIPLYLAIPPTAQGTDEPHPASKQIEKLELSPALERRALDFEVILARFHSAVWEAGEDEDGRTDYDMAGIDEAKIICGLYRRLLAQVATPPAAATSAPCASGEGLPDRFADKSTATPLEKARRVLNSIHDGWTGRDRASSYFHDDGFPRKEIASDAMAVLDVLNALAATQAPAVPATPTHRHIARGTLYTELGRGTLQTAVPLTDMMELVAYVGENGQWWFRAPSEFDDDERFALIGPARTPTAGNTEDARSMGAVSEAAQGVLDALDDSRHDNTSRRLRSAFSDLRAALTQAASTGKSQA